MRRRYPLQPLIGVGALIKCGGEVLIVKRENEPGKGLWSIPGGLLELGERLIDGLKREVREETGLEVEVERLLGAIDNIVYDGEGKVLYHYVLIDYLCTASCKELEPSTDVKEARWITPMELDKLPTTEHLRTILTKAELL